MRLSKPRKEWKHMVCNLFHVFHCIAVSQWQIEIGKQVTKLHSLLKDSVTLDLKQTPQIDLHGNFISSPKRYGII